MRFLIYPKVRYRMFLRNTMWNMMKGVFGTELLPMITPLQGFAMGMYLYRRALPSAIDTAPLELCHKINGFRLVGNATRAGT